MYIILGIVPVYIVASFIFLRFPKLLHKKREWKPIYDTKVIAHRGSRLEGLPENTISAFKKSGNLDDVDCLELDVWRTRDGKVVVHHDKTLERMTGHDIHMREVVYEEIPPITPSPGQSEAIKHIAEQHRHEWENVPLFEDVIDIIDETNKFLIIEFKYDDDELIQMVWEIIKKRKLENRCVWFSLIHKVNLKLGEFDPDIPRVGSVLMMLKVILLYYSGLWPFFEYDCNIFGLPCDKVDYDRVRHTTGIEFFPDWLCRVIAYLFGGDPPLIMIPPKLFQNLKNRGIPVWLLGINDEHALKVAENSGATGFLTDRPEWLTTHLNETK